MNITTTAMMMCAKYDKPPDNFFQEFAYIHKLKIPRIDDFGIKYGHVEIFRVTHKATKWEREASYWTDFKEAVDELHDIMKYNDEWGHKWEVVETVGSSEKARPESTTFNCKFIIKP